MTTNPTRWLLKSVLCAHRCRFISSSAPIVSITKEMVALNISMEDLGHCKFAFYVG